MKRRLQGANDLVQILLVFGLVAATVSILMDHLRVRQEMLYLARERSDVAFRVRQAEDQARHLSLEERLRQASVSRQAAATGFDAATSAQRVQMAGEPALVRDAE